MCCADQQAAKEAFADVDWLLSSTLVSAYTVLSELLRAKELSEQDQAKATTWTHFCATLIKVLEIVCRLRAAQGREEEMRQEMARAGMVAMCAKFVGDQRGGYHQSAILPSDSGDWLERLKVILDGLWKEFAKELKLKSCSNLVSLG